VLWRAGRRAVAVVVIIAAVGSGLLVEGFKRLYGRDRLPGADGTGRARRRECVGPAQHGALQATEPGRELATMTRRGRRLRVCTIVPPSQGVRSQAFRHDPAGSARPLPPRRAPAVTHRSISGDDGAGDRKGCACARRCWTRT
jgi:hypothetical protein